MDKNKLMEQLRKAVRDVIQEELGKSSYDATKGISTTELRDKKGKVVGYVKHKETDKGLVAGGRIGPKAAKAVTAEEKTTINIPVAALPSYKKGEQPTVINPKTGEEEIESDVSSWAKALERRFGHLKPGESASLKGDPKDVKKPVKESNTIIDKMKEKGVPTSDDKDVYKHVFGKERPRGKGSKSVEDKARDMGQMDMFTLEEFLGMLEEAGYSLTEKFNPEPELQERNKENKAKKDAEIADTGWALRGQPGGAKGGTPNDELVKNKQRGRKDAKTVYGDKYDRQPGRYIPKTELGKSLLKGLKPK